MENPIWTPPAGELITALTPYRGNLLVFTDKGIYELVPPRKLKWYQRLWRKIGRSAPRLWAVIL